jgi:glycosyltransferase involved in cell wall biosynthesis
VVIPAKDDAELLLHCLRALVHQSLTPREIIVVDNGSSDRASMHIHRGFTPS